MVAVEHREVRGPHEALRAVIEARLGVRRRKKLHRRARDSGEKPCALREEIRLIGVVAAEELVATLTRQHDLDGGRRELCDQERRQGRRVRERLVEDVGEEPQQRLAVRP